MFLKRIYVPVFFVGILALSSVANSLLDQSGTISKTGWQNVSLEDTSNFDANARYRVKPYNDDGTPNSGWIYPTMIAPNILFMTVSTAQFAFGAITSDKKGSWHYRKQGDCAHRPSGYENTEWNVAEIQMILE